MYPGGTAADLAAVQGAIKAAPDATIQPDVTRGQDRWILPTVLLALFMGSAARQTTRPISDFDTFWHVRLGEDILQSRSLTAPTTSWSQLSDQDWVPTQWLTELAMAAMHRTGGLPGVAVLFAASVLLLIVVVHGICRRFAGATAAAFVTGMCVVAMAPSLSPRPHMVTYIFLAVTLSAWLRTSQDLKPRWWLIAVTWVWSMSHGMWFTGPVLGLAITAGLLADRRLRRGDVARLFAVSALSIVSAGLTPIGPKLLTAPFAVAGVSAFITEWQAPSFRMVGPAMAMAMAATVALAAARREQRLPWTHVAILLLGTAWILLAARTVTLGALLLAPLVAQAVQELLRQPRDVSTRRERAVVAAWAVSCLAVVAVVLPTTADQPAAVPSGLDSHLSTLPPGAVVVNAYELGGWLRWAHPDLEPVVDGMTEAYSIEYLRDYGTVQAVSAGWEDILHRWAPDAALVAEGSPLATALTDRAGWTQVDSDDAYLLLVPTGAQP